MCVRGRKCLLLLLLYLPSILTEKFCVCFSVCAKITKQLLRHFKTTHAETKLRTENEMRRRHSNSGLESG